MDLPKYARWEHERKFLVQPELITRFAQQAYWQIDDKYFERGRLRLRPITESDTGRKTFKICKKFESPSCLSAPMVNIYLSEIEYRELSVIRGAGISKRRYHEEFRGHTFGVDLFSGELSGLVLCETEGETEEATRKIEFPDFVLTEVTQDLFFTGGNLCRITAAELKENLARVSSKKTHSETSSTF